MSKFSLLKPNNHTHSKLQSKLYHLLVSRGCSVGEAARAISISAYNDVLAEHILSMPALLEEVVHKALERDQKVEEWKLKPKPSKMRESATQLYWEWGGKKEELSDFLKLTPSKKQHFLTNMFSSLYPDVSFPYEWMASHRGNSFVTEGAPVVIQKTKKSQLKLNTKLETEGLDDSSSQAKRQSTSKSVQSLSVRIDDSKPDSNPLSIGEIESALSESFKWPSTYAIHTENNLPEIQWPKVGMLNAVGYKVGSDGLSLVERTSTLKQVYGQTLPEVESRKYVSEWGEPFTEKRLRKLAYTIASLARNAKRRKRSNMQLAIEHWEADLNWLKLEYYIPMSHMWSWPNTQVSDCEGFNFESDSLYMSSREFLIEQYTNPNNETICQVCNLPLPFKLKSGDYFWEEIPVTPNISEEVCSNLVLCPNHRAMYEHANETSPLDLLDALKNGANAPLVVRLAGNNYELSLTALHRHLLKKLLNRQGTEAT
ncbi:hypothetical protein [Vibrio mediterranei]|uniref:Uncharacterized protein n=1 Tax=Vibrio mediterranei TaxID=689 RepID=A0A3G4VFH0_9VIBR|nr:hypothetical protein [Vibrio mediterranei]AYV22758.1 hypothetical protein ECB94_16520 [Vibrio mediterranei]